MSIAEGLLFSEPFLWEGKSYVVDVYRHAAKKDESVAGRRNRVETFQQPHAEEAHRDYLCFSF